MILKDISFKSPIENILFDEVLLNLAEQGHSGEVLRFWESDSDFVVLGRIGKESEDVDIAELSEVNVPVLRRSSGGGTVVQGKGCLNYSLILSKSKRPDINDIRKSYDHILSKVINALGNLNVKASYWPISDIALTDGCKKISGNAQKRTKNFVLHHGTLLYNFDLAKIYQFLKMPKEIPEYRKHRSHKDFVTNIIPKVNSADLKAVLTEVFNAKSISKLSDLERSLLDQYLIAKK